MSQHIAFRRQPVPAQAAQKHIAVSIPAPTRGLTLSENYAFMKPGGAMICDNWVPTMRGVKLRGGCALWCQLPETTPVISAFEYVSAGVQRMFAANAAKLYDVTASPVLVKAGQLSGNYGAAQMANAEGDFLIAVNDAGDPPLRFNGATWEVLDAAYVPPVGMPSKITGPVGSAVVNGGNLTYVCKYRNRLFFIELNSMNAWYLPLNSVGGELQMIPLSGAASRGGKLLFCATWALDAGDGLDDKLVFCTTLGELIIFTGGDPGVATGATPWHQEGKYQVDPPMGMNAHVSLGGDLLIATVDGIIPVSAAISKDAGQLDVTKTTYNIRSMWRVEAIDKREWAWSMKRWDEYGGMFVTWPGGSPGRQYCAVVNTATMAWCRFVGWDATCFAKLRGDMFFGTQSGRIMQADRTGYDDGVPYTATYVGHWGPFQGQPSTLVWHQARASFSASFDEPFQPQLNSCVDFIIKLPPPPQAGSDPGIEDAWDQGAWGPPGSSGDPPGSLRPPPPADIEAYAQWDQFEAVQVPVVRHTGWGSIGSTGYTHAPVVQVTVAQRARPIVEMICIDATFERLGVNV